MRFHFIVSQEPSKEFGRLFRDHLRSSSDDPENKIRSFGHLALEHWTKDKFNDTGRFRGFYKRTTEYIDDWPNMTDMIIFGSGVVKQLDQINTTAMREHENYSIDNAEIVNVYLVKDSSADGLQQMKDINVIAIDEETDADTRAQMVADYNTWCEGIHNAFNNIASDYDDDAWVGFGGFAADGSIIPDNSNTIKVIKL